MEIMETLENFFSGAKSFYCTLMNFFKYFCFCIYNIIFWIKQINYEFWNKELSR